MNSAKIVIGDSRKMMEIEDKTIKRKNRARALVRVLKKLYPRPKSELHYQTQFQFVVAVILSAQATDKKVNEITPPLFKEFRTACDFAQLTPAQLASRINAISFFNNKAKYIIGAAKMICEKYRNRVPRSRDALLALPGVADKTADVVLGELFDIWEGIAVDTHVRRFALKFDLCDSKNPTKIARCLESLIPRADWKYVNNGFVLYGRYVCSARPHDCSNHPLTKIWPPAAERWPSAR